MVTIYNTASTLDGFLATTDNSLSWLFEVSGGDGSDSSFDDFLAGIGAMAMGSTTYEWLLAHERPHESPGKWQEWYADRPSWVFTHRELPVVPDADIRFTSDGIAGVHAEMVAAAGDRDIWLIGGGDLVGQFDDVGLLDRIVVTIAPVTLGAGAPLLPREIRSDRLTLTSIEQRGQFAELTYAVTPRLSAT
jgi:dihydrofolate reductase